MKKQFILYTFSALVFLMVACNQDEPLAIVYGTVTGHVVTPSGVIIPGATVKTLNTIEAYETFTDADGNFTLSVPVGDQVLEVSTGDGFIFKSEIEITVVQNEVVTVNEVSLRQVGAIAYISGEFDEIEHIVVDELGYEADQILQSDLTEESFIYDYVGLFLNCSYSNVTAEMTQGVQNFITNGGSVYASDFASAYLLGNTTYDVCPNNRDGLGFMDADILCTSRVGSAETLQADITDSDIASFVGVSKLDIEYDLPLWEHINDYSGDYWDVVVASNQGAPLMIKRSGPEDPRDDKPFGNIYYTTFHNHVGESVSPEIQKILEYVVLNL